MKMWSAPHCMKSIPLGRHVLYKEIKRDVRQRPFATAGLEPDEATVCPAHGISLRRPLAITRR
jgi:hypothetical protein